VRKDGRLVGGIGGRIGYITEKNVRSSCEWERIVTFCTCILTSCKNKNNLYLLCRTSNNSSLKDFYKKNTVIS
jgi:hypothetical protein